MSQKPLGSLKKEKGKLRLIMSWNQQVVLIFKIVKKIIQSGFKPKLVISIATGGMYFGPIIARIFGVPHAVWMAQHYTDNKKTGTGTLKKKIVFAKHIVFISQDGRVCELTKDTIQKKYKEILLVDDLCDTGGTFHEAIKLLRDWFGQGFGLRTVSIWHKERHTFFADFIGELIKPDKNGRFPWIVQAHELAVEELSKKLKKDLKFFNKS